MSLSLLTRSSARQLVTRARSLHTTTPIRDAHGHYHVGFGSVFAVYAILTTFPQHLPFDLPTAQNKGVFGLKVTAYLLTGFSIPFAAVWWQLYVLRTFVSSLLISWL
ncbi:hypothetical protein AN958_00847 [Leucoagaricus sp. SymC.cos]|nr:hypothetical protein AN958_00847 [Leucoagaricus sp. SymC.cos]